MMKRLGGAVALVFVLAACNPGLTNEREGDPALLDVSESALTKDQGGTNGDIDYCSGSALCAATEGDCDSDAECEPGLVCGVDVGLLYGMPEGYDVCRPTTCWNGIRDLDETIGIDDGGPCGTRPTCAANGQIDTCSTVCRGAVGWGDCDSDAQCQTGLVCGADNGLLFGMPESFDVCWKAHCTNGTQDGDETSVDRGGSCGTQPTCAPDGQADTCTTVCRCDVGGGDCDSNSQCKAGLVCGTDNGPRFSKPEGFDVCWPAHCTDGLMNGDETGVDAGGSCGTPPTCGANGQPDTCSAACKCDVGGGDCDSDSQCKAGLVCGTDNGLRFGFPEGLDVCWKAHCTNGRMDGDETAIDAGGSCGTPPTCPPNGQLDTCSVECKCDVGGGDCDSDAQCAAGLVCGTDNGPSYGMPAGYDVCEPNPLCSNGVLDRGETLMDCGGICAACTDGFVDVVTSGIPLDEFGYALFDAGGSIYDEFNWWDLWGGEYTFVPPGTYTLEPWNDVPGNAGEIYVLVDPNPIQLTIAAGEAYHWNIAYALTCDANQGYTNCNGVCTYLLPGEQCPGL